MSPNTARMTGLSSNSFQGFGTRSSLFTRIGHERLLIASPQMLVTELFIRDNLFAQQITKPITINGFQLKHQIIYFNLGILIVCIIYAGQGNKSVKDSTSFLV